jgi:hypothetical protein
MNKPKHIKELEIIERKQIKNDLTKLKIFSSRQLDSICQLSGKHYCIIL